MILIRSVIFIRLYWVWWLHKTLLMVCSSAWGKCNAMLCLIHCLLIYWFCVPPETVCLSRNVVIYSSSLSPQLYPVADGAKYSKLLNDLSSSEVGHLPGTQFGKTGSLGTSHRHKMLTAIEKLYLSGGNDFERNPRWSLLAFPGPVIFVDEVCVCVWGDGGGGEGGLD